VKSLLRLATPFALSLALAAPAWAATAPPPQSKDTAVSNAAPATVQTPAKRGFFCNMVGAAPASYWKSKQHAKAHVPKADKAQQLQPVPQP
jgi:hypothetical protein